VVTGESVHDEERMSWVADGRRRCLPCHQRERVRRHHVQNYRLVRNCATVHLLKWVRLL